MCCGHYTYECDCGEKQGNTIFHLYDCPQKAFQETVGKDYSHKVTGWERAFEPANEPV
jgi:hypothetical protein